MGLTFPLLSADTTPSQPQVCSRRCCGRAYCWEPARKEAGLLPPREGGQAAVWVGWRSPALRVLCGQRLRPHSTVYPRPHKKPLWRRRKGKKASLPLKRFSKWFGPRSLYISPVLALKVLEKLVRPRTEGGRVAQERQSLSFQQGWRLLAFVSAEHTPFCRASPGFKASRL